MHWCRSMDSLDMRVVKLQLDICRHLMVLLRLVVDKLVVLAAIVELVAIVVQLVGSIGSIVVVVRCKLVVEVPSDWLVLDCGVQRYHRLGNLGICVDQLQLDIVQLFVVLRQVPQWRRMLPEKSLQFNPQVFFYNPAKQVFCFTFVHCFFYVSLLIHSWQLSVLFHFFCSWSTHQFEHVDKLI